MLNILTLIKNRTRRTMKLLNCQQTLSLVSSDFLRSPNNNLAARGGLLT